MVKKHLLVSFLFVIIFLFVCHVFADNLYSVADFDDDKVVETFASRFKKAVVDNDKQGVASMIHYPIEAMFKNRNIIIKNEQEFISFYNDIFDKRLHSAISNASTHNMFANYQGVMFGDGEAWFSKEAGAIKVVAVGACRRYYPDTK